MPQELRDDIYSLIMQDQKREEVQLDADHTVTPTSLVRQVYKSGFYDSKLVQKPPYDSEKYFLEIPRSVRLASKDLVADYYETLLRKTFKAGSTICATVADFNFDFVCAFLETLNLKQVEKIKSKQVTFIIRFELEALSDIKFEALKLDRFNTILLKTFSLQDRDQVSSASVAKLDDLDDMISRPSHSIVFEYTRVPGMSPPEDVNIIREWQRDHREEMRFLGPFFEQWEKDNPFGGN